MRSIICLKALLKLDSSGTEANSGNQILDPDKIWKKTDSMSSRMLQQLVKTEMVRL